MSKDIELNLLISESFEIDPGDLMEDINKGTKVLSFTTPLNHTSRKTYNGNLFDRPFLESGINSERFQRRLKNNNVLGEFQHPTRDNPERYVQVYDDYASHRINKVWFDGELLMGEVQTLTFSKGPHLSKKIAEGIVPAFSLRAVGKVRKDGRGNKEKYLEIITWDNVFDASERAAWANKESLSVKSPHSNDEGNNIAQQIFMESNVENIQGTFRDVDSDLELIAESLNGTKPDKIIYSPNDDVIGYYSENVSAYRKIEKNLSKEINDFMRL